MPSLKLATGSIDDIMNHPVRRYFNKGLDISINTDDPGMFHNSMAEEYALLIHKVDFKRSEIKKLILNAVQSSWRPDKIGPSLIKKFTNNNNWA